MPLKSNNKDILQGSLTRNILMFSLPLMLSGVLQLMFNAADLVVVGKFDNEGGSLAQAAIGSTGAMINLLVNLFIGISAGVNVVIARLIGAKNQTALKSAIQTAMSVSIIAGVVVSVAGYIFTEPLLHLINTDEDVMPYAIEYLRIYFIGAPFSMIYNFGSAIMRANGDTKRPTYYLLLGGVINVILNLIAVIVFDLSAAGVAIATSTSSLIACVLVVTHLIKTNDQIKLYLKGFKIHKQHLGSILSVGLPAGIQSSLFSLSNVIIQSAVNSFGDPHITAGNGNAANLEGFAYVCINSIYQAALTFTGRCCGAKRYDLLNKIYARSIILATVFGITVSGLFLIFRHPLMALYASSSADIAAGINRMLVVMSGYFLIGLMDTSTGFLRGMGASLRPMIIVLIGACGIRILWVYTIFKQFHTPFMLYISYPISWAVTSFALFLLTFFVKRQLINPKIKKIPEIEENKC